MQKRNIRVISTIIIILFLAMIAAKTGILFSPVDSIDESYEKEQKNDVYPSLCSCNRIQNGDAADLNNDDKIDFNDYYLIVNGFDAFDCQADLNNDCKVNDKDLQIFYDEWTGTNGCPEGTIKNTIGQCTPLTCEAAYRQTPQTNYNLEDIVLPVTTNEQTNLITLKETSGTVMLSQNNAETIISDIGHNIQRILDETRTTYNLQYTSSYIIILDDEPIGQKFGLITSNPTPSEKNTIDLYKNSLEEKQRQIIEKINEIDPSIEKTTQFNLVLNALVVKNVKNAYLDDIKRIGGIKKIVKNEIVTSTLEESVPLISAPEVWRTLDSEGNNITGESITIAIIDTGIDYTHQDLGNCTEYQFQNGLCQKVKRGYDFINNDYDPLDDNGHGTHVAATAAGNGPIKGVAPGAILYAYKVLNATGSGNFAGIISGIEKSADPNQDGNTEDHVDIISMSLGGSGDQNSPMSFAVDTATSLGILTVAAAGNRGDNPYISDTGPAGWVYQTISAPGTARTALTVGATNKTDYPAVFSSGGPVRSLDGDFILKPDVTAPGVKICAAVSSSREQAFNQYLCMDNEHISISGTSMATPHVSGVAALLKQKYPGLSPFELKNLIIQATEDIGNFTQFKTGNGRVDALRTLDESQFLTYLQNNSFDLILDNTPRLSLKSKRIVGQNSLGVRIKRVEYKLNQNSLSNIIVSLPQVQGCVNSTEGISLETDIPLAQQNYGFYSGELIYEIYDKCNFSSIPERKTLPIVFHKYERYFVTYTKTNPGTSEVSAQIICYNREQDSPNFNDRIVEGETWSQTQGETITIAMSLTHSIDSYQTCITLITDVSKEGQATKVNYLTGPTQRTSEFSDNQATTEDQVFKHLLREISTNEKPYVINILIGANIVSELSICDDINLQVKSNNYLAARELVNYIIETTTKNTYKPVFGFKHIYIASSQEGIINRHDAKNKIIVVNPFANNNNIQRIVIDSRIDLTHDLLSGNIQGITHSFANKTYLTYPYIAEYQKTNYGASTEYLSSSIASLIPTENENLSIYLAYGPVAQSPPEITFFNSLAHGSEYLATSPQGSLLYQSYLIDNNTNSKISIGGIGKITTTKPNHQTTNGTGLSRIGCRLYTQQSNPQIGDCMKGTYSVTWNYQDDFRVIQNSPSGAEQMCIDEQGYIIPGVCLQDFSSNQTFPN